MKRLFVAIIALCLALPGSAAVAASPVITVTLVNCQNLSIQGTGLPANATVDLTVIGSDTVSGARFTKKLQTSGTGTASATVNLRTDMVAFNAPLKVNGTYGVSIDTGIATLTIAGCLETLPSTSTN